MTSEAGGFTANAIPQQSVGVVSQNRFNRPEFGSPTTYNQIVDSGQVASNQRPSNGVEPQLDNAVAVFTGLAGDIVGGSTCYWSPQNSEMTPIQAAFTSGTTTFPSGTLDPRCYYTWGSGGGSQTQIVWKTSMPNNVLSGYQNAPAFLFERQRSPTDPSVIQIQ